MSKEQQIKELESKFKAVMPNASKEQIAMFVQLNLTEEEVIPVAACRIDDPDCLSCGS
jgi:hypothetical protein